MTPLPSTATQEMNPDSQLATGGWAAKCTLLKGSLGEASIRARRSAAAFAWASLSICPPSCANRGRQMRQRLATILKDMFSCHSRSYNPRRHKADEFRCSYQLQPLTFLAPLSWSDYDSADLTHT